MYASTWDRDLKNLTVVEVATGRRALRVGAGQDGGELEAVRRGLSGLDWASRSSSVSQPQSALVAFLKQREQELHAQTRGRRILHAAKWDFPLLTVVDEPNDRTRMSRVVATAKAMSGPEEARGNLIARARKDGDHLLADWMTQQEIVDIRGRIVSSPRVRA